jgi:hypothetical protein
VVIVTDLAVLTKTAPGRVPSFVTDRASRAPLANCSLLVWSGKKEVARVRTGADGLADVKLGDANPDTTLVWPRSTIARCPANREFETRNGNPLWRSANGLRAHRRRPHLGEPFAT